MKSMLTIKYIYEGNVYEVGENGDERIRVEASEGALELAGAESAAFGRVKVTALADIELADAWIETGDHYMKMDRLMLNGYQSWSDTREFMRFEKLRNIQKMPSVLRTKYHLDMFGETPFYKYHDEILHAFTYAYSRMAGSDSAMLYGSLNDSNAYTLIEYNRNDMSITLRSDVGGRELANGESFSLFDYVRLTGDAVPVQKAYFTHLGYKCDAPYLRGYTSWYNHYQDIDEQKIQTALDGMDSSEFDLFQIDDGFETFVGDWFDIDSSKFPNGLADIVKQIHGKGLKAGLWLAPCVCELDSRLYKEHPDWILRDSEGKPVSGGCNWSGMIVLDMNNPEVVAYIRSFLKFYKDMGFDFFKLDFLYAAVRSGGNGTETRAETMRRMMKLFREVLGDSMILGCGVPMASAFGMVDYCRIGQDITLEFDDKPYSKFTHRERASTKIALRNMIWRGMMDGYVFRCDPDVFLLREENNSLSEEQKQALLTLGHLMSGINLTSDDVGEYDENKKALLHEARKLVNAEVTRIRSDRRFMTITYMLDGEDHVIRFNHVRGVIEDE